MINQAITELNELATLLDEVSAMIDELQPVPSPVAIAKEDVEIVFDVAPVTSYSFQLPRRAKIISMYQNVVSQKTFANLRFCTNPSTLTTTISIDS